MQLSIRSDLKKLTKKLTALEKKQIPFALAKAVTDTAKSVQVAVTRQLKSDIDRPTPFTQKAVGMKRATKKNPEATIFIKPIQSKYLKYQIDGGTRKATADSPVLIAREKQRNKYGNLPRNKLSRLKAQSKLIVKDRLAMQRLKRSVKPLAYFAKQAVYKPRFKFYERAKSTTQQTFKHKFKAALRQALATAR